MAVALYDVSCLETISPTKSNISLPSTVYPSDSHTELSDFSEHARLFRDFEHAVSLRMLFLHTYHPSPDLSVKFL